MPAPPTKLVVTGSAAGATWQLEQMDGMRLPAQPTPGAEAMAGERRVRLDDWPYLDLGSGPVRLPLALAWRYRGGAIGDVRFEVEPAQTQAGCTLAVTAQLSDGPDTATLLAQRIALRHTFSGAGRPDVNGLTTLTLFGDGTYERQDRWEQPRPMAA
jgi:hypothetical protein